MIVLELSHVSVILYYECKTFFLRSIRLKHRLHECKYGKTFKQYINCHCQKAPVAGISYMCATDFGFLTKGKLHAVLTIYSHEALEESAGGTNNSLFSGEQMNANFTDRIFQRLFWLKKY